MMIRKIGKVFLILLGMVLSSEAWSQDTYTLKGKVQEEGYDGGLPGATVTVEGTQNGAITDINGEFKLNVSGAETLVIQFVGLKTQKVALGNRTEITVTMTADAVALEEVVVTGFGSIQKSELTGAVSSVDAKALEGIPVSDVTQAIQGRLAGVQVLQGSGAPGSPTTVKIRGTGSITGSSEPLYVVDGVIVDNINYLSPSDIATQEVMKDASVAALYGAQGANGVVVITTKQGEKGKLRVDFSAQAGITEFWDLPDMMDSREFLIFQSLVNGGSPSKMDSAFANFDTYENNDWLDLISQNGFKQQYNVALSGGGEKVNYRVSSSYFDEEGLLINSDFDRVNFTSDLTIKPIKSLEVRANVLYSDRNRHVQNTNDRNGVLRRAVSDSPIVPLYSDLGYPENNPLRKAQQNYDRRDEDNLQLKFWFKARPFKGLELTSRFGYNLANNDRRRFEFADPRYEAFARPNETSRVINNVNQSVKWNFDQLVTFNKKLYKNHKLSTTAAFTMTSRTNSSLLSQGRSALGNDLNTAYLVNGFSDFNVDGNAGEWRQIGGILRANYSIKGKYLFLLSARADASSRFAKGSRWGVFPSASAAWVFSDDLLPDSDFMTLGKIRATYGILGNSNIGNNDYLTTVNTGDNNNVVYGSDAQFNLYRGYAPNTIGNPNITWETTYDYDLGFDFEFWSRLSFTTDIFLRETKDLLLQVPVESSTGLITNPNRNLGVLQNRGIELSLNYKESVGDWSFDISANATYLENVIKDLGPNKEPVVGGEVVSNGDDNPLDFGFVTRSVVNGEIGAFYGHVVDRIDADGDFVFKDLDGDGVVTNNDKTIIGSPQPDWTYGLVLGAKYKQFDFSVAFQGVLGNEIFNVLNANFRGYNIVNSRQGNSLAGTSRDVWRLDLDFSETEFVPEDVISDYSGSNSNATLPRVLDFASDDSYRYPSDFYIEDGSYLRVRNVQLGYNLSKNVLSALGLTSCRFYFTGNNLFTWTKYNGFDPEVGSLADDDQSGAVNISTGLDYGTYPQAKSYILGVNLSF